MARLTFQYKNHIFHVKSTITTNERYRKAGASVRLATDTLTARILVSPVTNLRVLANGLMADQHSVADGNKKTCC